MNDSRKPLVAGNWKMFKPPSEAGPFCEALRQRLPALSDREVVVFPSFVSLPVVAAKLAGSAIAWGGQNMHWEKQGAYTGEVSPLFLAELGCRYVLVGHSERRALFGEDDAACNRKVRAALAVGLRPVLCCGETLHQRESGLTFEVLSAQLDKGLEGVELSAELVVAYEPVWAIGTGRNASPEQAEEVHAWIRGRLGGAAEAVRILYGGSVKPENVDSLLGQPDIDGVLVGGASLDLEAFVRIAGFGRRGQQGASHLTSSAVRVV